MDKVEGKNHIYLTALPGQGQKTASFALTPYYSKKS